METLQGRLLQLIERKKMSQDDLAAMVGASQAAISKILLGETKRSKLIPQIAEALGVSEQWLIYGTPPSNLGEERQNIDVWDDGTKMPDGMVSIPYFNGISLSAGYGALNADSLYSGASLWFSKSFIKRRDTMPDRVFCTNVKGDSMEPRYNEGGIVMIDTTPREIVDGKVYAITHQDFDYIKYLRRLPGNRLLITSENNLYAPFEANIEDINIIGRVIAYQREE